MKQVAFWREKDGVMVKIADVPEAANLSVHKAILEASYRPFDEPVCVVAVNPREHEPKPPPTFAPGTVFPNSLEASSSLDCPVDLVGFGLGCELFQLEGDALWSGKEPSEMEFSPKFTLYGVTFQFVKPVRGCKVELP